MSSSTADEFAEMTPSGEWSASDDAGVPVATSVSDVSDAARETTPSDTSDASPSRTAMVADSLASAVVTMFLLTIVQRGTGFLRSVLVCRFLSPEELGYWNMAKSFLVLAAPLDCFGIAGGL